MTLGIFWVGQQTQLNHLARSDRSLSWIHILFLFAVSRTPFSTTLLAGFTRYRIALVAYWFNLLLLGVPLYFSWQCARALRGGRSALPGEHVLEHRVYRSGATQLCGGPADSRARS